MKEFHKLVIDNQQYKPIMGSPITGLATFSDMSPARALDTVALSICNEVHFHIDEVIHEIFNSIKSILDEGHFD